MLFALFVIALILLSGCTQQTSPANSDSNAQPANNNLTSYCKIPKIIEEHNYVSTTHGINTEVVKYQLDSQNYLLMIFNQFETNQEAINMFEENKRNLIDLNAESLEDCIIASISGSCAKDKGTIAFYWVENNIFKTAIKAGSYYDPNKSLESTVRAFNGCRLKSNYITN